MTSLTPLEESLRAKRDAGRKLLVPYVTGGLKGWTDAIRAAAANGADVIEIGLPFSDPVMDGPIIQEASQRALDDGATPVSILEGVRTLDVDVPLVVMCYYNTVHHRDTNGLHLNSFRPESLERLFQTYLLKSRALGVQLLMPLVFPQSCLLHQLPPTTASRRSAHGRVASCIQ